MLFETFRLALRSIRRNLMRSFLTVLGVVIGVAAVIAMVTIGQGSSAQVTANIEGLGTNVAFMRAGAQRMGPPTGGPARPFRLNDVEAIAALPEVDSASPVMNSTRTAVAGNANLSTQVTGAFADYLTLGNYTLASGRAFSDAEDRGGVPVCIIGATVARSLFGGLDPVGQMMRVGTVSCPVIGTYAEKGSSTFGQDQDNGVLMPARAVMRRLLGSNDFNQVSIGFAEGVTMEDGMAAVTDLMRDRRRIAFGQADDFNISDQRQFAEMLTGVNDVLTGLLSSVAAVSLLVGGIGIMNIMLVSVTERTREIGIRLAVGAEARQVLMQFLVEAVVLSVLGGLAGILAGLGIAWGASLYMAIPFVPDPAVIALAFGFSGLVGVVFGYFPARAAAALDPIEALRHQ